MVTENHKNWRENYMPGKTDLSILIPCNTITYLEKEHRDVYDVLYDTNNGKTLREWIDSMNQMKRVIDSDINNAVNCVKYIARKYPHSKINPSYYGIEIWGLSESEMLDCIDVEGLFFDVYLEDKLPQND